MKNILSTCFGLCGDQRASKKFILVGVVVLMFGLVLGHGVKNVFAQAGPSELYVPLIGITAVPFPLALPSGAGDVTYKYAVKNFLSEYPLSDVRVVDNTCSPVTFIEGDDNGDSQLDFSETWRYTCTTRVSETSQSTATATGVANNLTATHKAYATVVVGSDNPPPLVSIVNITKIAYPLSLPAEGGDIAFTYRVNNPGAVPLSDVTVIDDKCSAMSKKLGDTNGNSLLDLNEVWVYTCSTNLTKTTTNTVNVTAYANGFQAVGYATITVTVDIPTPDFPVGINPNLPEVGAIFVQKNIAWGVLATILLILIISLVVIQKNQPKITPEKRKPFKKL
jgi:hypothetical protein